MSRNDSRDPSIRRRHLVLTSFVALMTILSLFSSARLALAQDDESTPEQSQEVAPGTGTVRINVYECPLEYRGDLYAEDCGATGMSDVSVRLTDLSVQEVIDQQNGADIEAGFDDFATTQTDGGPGVAEFTQLNPNQYTVIIDLLGATYNFASYCSDSDTGSENPVSPNDENNGQFTLEDGQNVVCDWYIIPDPDGTVQREIETGVTATGTSEPTLEAEPTEEIAEPTEEQETIAPTEDSETFEPTAESTGELGGAADGGAITIDMRSCPDDFVDPRSANFETFAAECAEGTDGVTLRLTDSATQEFVEQVTTTESNNTFGGLVDGTFTLVSDVPGDAASEYLYCVADGGDRYQKEFDENGATTFFDMTGEQIECSWFVVPEDSRGEETGGSLTIHLAACPADYLGSNYFEDCHDEGIGNSPFELEGPAGSTSGTTSIPESGGPGLLSFTALEADSYTLSGGPPGDFGTVFLLCSDQQTNEQITAELDSTQASLDIAEGQDILCDWYYLPEDASGEPTAEPTTEPESRAEILVTLFECEPRADGYAGLGFGDLDDACTETLNDVPFRLGDVGAPPLTANTGVSGDGAVRFFDLLSGDYTVKPTLPSELSNVALYCSIDGSNSVYQKSLQNGETTFVDVDGEAIACSWFVSGEAEQPAGPNGSITVREFVCEGDKGTITDWDQECTAGASGSGYTLTSGDGAASVEGTPDTSGVVVFDGLANDFYTLEQNDGTWCRATAEYVDSSSRVIVKDDGNTDVFLFHCGDVTSLPSTGTGADSPSGGDDLSGSTTFLLMAAVLLVPAFIMVFWTRIREVKQPVATESDDQNQPTVTENGMFRMRFR
ncbi:MAG: hypothetical protein WKF81_01545 [Thermomicrobiales bacterium]